jgi:hypothetical protein
MSARWFNLFFAVAAVATLPLQAQAPKAAASNSSTTTTKWTPPRTPWGDPDLQGWFTNLSEDGTPLERPDQFAGRQLGDIKGAELAAIKEQVQKRTITTFQGPLHAPEHWWQDDLNLVKGSQAWLIVDPPDGKIPELTPQAKERTAARAAARRNSGRGPADSWTDLTLYDRCITRGLPGSMMPAIYGNSYQIVQSPGFVAIRYEMVHETRLIPVVAGGKEERPHTAPAIRSYMGDPRGHWEGDALVVETVNFRDESTYRGANAATLKLVERFRRTAPDKVKWAVTVDDPETWTKPWTFSMPLTMDDSQPVLEYGCHEGNYGLRNILSEARNAEKKAAEGAAKK